MSVGAQISSRSSPPSDVCPTNLFSKPHCYKSSDSFQVPSHCDKLITIVHRWAWISTSPATQSRKADVHSNVLAPRRLFLLHCASESLLLWAEMLQQYNNHGEPSATYRVFPPQLTCLWNFHETRLRAEGEMPLPQE